MNAVRGEREEEDVCGARKICALVADPKPTQILLRSWCQYDYYGCKMEGAVNYRAWVNVNVPSMCQFSGCNDTEATNYYSHATYNDGTCQYSHMGCMVNWQHQLLACKISGTSISLLSLTLTLALTLMPHRDNLALIPAHK